MHTDPPQADKMRSCRPCALRLRWQARAEGRRLPRNFHARDPVPMAAWLCVEGEVSEAPSRHGEVQNNLHQHRLPTFSYLAYRINKISIAIQN
jgi:hypothetical protein